MTEKPTHPDLAYHLRRLLETVKEACGAEGRWKWLAGPVALLMWIRTRGMRSEREAALEQFKGVVEAFLGLLEDFRAGKLVAPVAPQVHEPLRSSASSAVKILDRGERREAQRSCQAAMRA